MPKETSAHRAGLTFSVSIIENAMFPLLNYKLTKRLSVPITAVMEYLTAEILELSGNVARDDKKVRIKINHIILAIKNDGELSQVFDVSDTVVPEDTPKFQTYTHRVLKQVHPDTGINSDSIRFLDKLLHDFMKLLASKYPIERKNIDTIDIINASLPGELAKHAVTEATKALTKYQNTFKNE